MNKITSPQFQLSNVLAMQLSGTAYSGANRPLIIKGVDLETRKQRIILLVFKQILKPLIMKYGTKY